MKIVTTAFVLGLMSTAAIASDVNPQVEIENLQKRVLELQLKKALELLLKLILTCHGVQHLMLNQNIIWFHQQFQLHQLKQLR